MKRRGSRPGEETPFVDLAFSMLGPIAAIMIVLAVGAARPSPCEAIDPETRHAKAAELRLWFDRLMKNNEAAWAYLESDPDCPAARALPSAERPPELEPLRGLCPAEIEQVRKEAAIGAEDIDRAVAEQARLTAALASCRLHAIDCDKLTEPQRGERAAQLRRWWSELQGQIGRSRTFLDEACPDLRGAPRPRVDRPAWPEPLIGLCRSEAEVVIAKAGLDERMLTDFAREQAAVAGAVAQCRPMEVITVSEDQLRFNSCSAEIRQGIEFFLAKARQIQLKLTDSSSYNRVDIFGHSDARPLTTCVVKVHRKGFSDADFVIHDNVMLSLLRADAFRNALVQAIRSNSEFADIRERMDQPGRGKLRFYAIGVGDAEPKATPEESRRIEIRFVTDREGALQ